MKSKNSVSLIAFAGLILFTSIALAELPIEDVVEKTCGSCHTAPGTERTAPPLFAVKRHLLKNFPEREHFVEHIVGWVLEPSADRALMHGAVRKFGVMPAQTLPPEQIRKIATYIYDNEFPSPMGLGMHSEKKHQGMKHNNMNMKKENHNHIHESKSTTQETHETEN